MTSPLETIAARVLGVYNRAAALAAIRTELEGASHE